MYVYGKVVALDGHVHAKSLELVEAADQRILARQEQHLRGQLEQPLVEQVHMFVDEEVSGQQKTNTNKSSQITFFYFFLKRYESYFVKSTRLTRISRSRGLFGLSPAIGSDERSSLPAVTRTALKSSFFIMRMMLPSISS